MAGKGSKPRPTNIKKFVNNFPKPSKTIDGFVKNKNKITKKY
jgi:hypothetical protein